jgi:2-isopropylmalate synthase
MDATTIGLRTNSIVLGKHSGRHALRNALEELGVRIDGQALNTAFKRFKEVADRKKHVTALDLEALVSDEIREQAEAYNLARFELHDASGTAPTAKVGHDAGGRDRGARAPARTIDALLERSTRPRNPRGPQSSRSAVAADTDALGEVSVLVGTRVAWSRARASRRTRSSVRALPAARPTPAGVASSTDLPLESQPGARP